MDHEGNDPYVTDLCLLQEEIFHLPRLVRLLGVGFGLHI
jgi:hypothetical protein